MSTNLAADEHPIRHIRIATNGLQLHAAVAGRGTPVLLLHGFPEHWRSWRRQLPALAEAGRSAWALDLRGYHLSDRPVAQAAYRMHELVADIAGVVRATGQTCCDIVGHDWGGVIAWRFAEVHPQLVRRLVVLNAPHHELFARELRHPRQMLRSAYAALFAIPWLPEATLAARDFALLRAMFTRVAVRRDAYSDAEIEAFVAPFRIPGALTAALNYYRANLWEPARQQESGRTITADTLVLWGERDPALGLHLLDGLDRIVPGVQVRRFPCASHWVHADEPDAVNKALISFLAA
jgi:pimeloyl-ACP methyl ester carboxylesterase